MPKGSSPSQFPSDYRLISITPIISKIYEKLISRRLFKFVDSIKVFLNTQFSFSKGLALLMPFCCCSFVLQYSLDKRAESRIVSLDFNSAFNLINHQGLLYKLRSMGVGGPVFSIFKYFLTNLQQLQQI